MSDAAGNLTASIVVAGWGHPLRGDDVAGQRVAEAVQRRWGSQVSVLSATHPLPEWASELAAARVAFLVDASVASTSEVPRIEVVRADATSASVGGHTLGVASLLALTRELFGSVPPVFLIHVPASDFSFGELISARTENGIAQAVDLLDREIAQRLGEKITQPLSALGDGDSGSFPTE